MKVVVRNKVVIRKKSTNQSCCVIDCLLFVSQTLRTGMAYVKTNVIELLLVGLHKQDMNRGFFPGSLQYVLWIVTTRHIILTTSSTFAFPLTLGKEREY